MPSKLTSHSILNNTTPLYLPLNGPVLLFGYDLTQAGTSPTNLMRAIPFFMFSPLDSLSQSMLGIGVTALV